MKLVLFVAAIMAANIANAASFYIVDGKQTTAGAAKKAGLQNAKAVIYKVQATRVVFNDDTGNLKKAADMTADEIKKVASQIK